MRGSKYYFMSVTILRNVPFLIGENHAVTGLHKKYKTAKNDLFDIKIKRQNYVIE